MGGATCSDSLNVLNSLETCPGMWRTLSQHSRNAKLKGVNTLKYQPTPTSILQHCFPIVTQRRFTNNASLTKELNLSDAQRETIYALSTPPGKAGVAVIRISGPDSQKVWQSMVKSYSSKNHPEPWKMERCRIANPENGEILDDGLSVFFRGEYWIIPHAGIHNSPISLGPKSFTTQDVLELHIHSGRAIISSVLAALSHLPFCRPAEAGEFTRRAFEGGRLDLTQVEGLKDLIDAETEGQRRIALSTAAVGEIVFDLG